LTSLTDNYGHLLLDSEIGGEIGGGVLLPKSRYYKWRLGPRNPDGIGESTPSRLLQKSL